MKDNIIEIQGRMFQVKRRIPLSSLNLEKYDDWPSMFKKFYHIDSLFKAQGDLWLCNEIHIIDYEEIRD